MKARLYRCKRESRNRDRTRLTTLYPYERSETEILRLVTVWLHQKGLPELAKPKRSAILRSTCIPFKSFPAYNRETVRFQQCRLTIPLVRNEQSRCQLFFWNRELVPRRRLQRPLVEEDAPALICRILLQVDLLPKPTKRSLSPACLRFTASSWRRSR
jgi:hypothetical protein